MGWNETAGYIMDGVSPREIENPENLTICVFDGVNSSAVYIGFMDSLRLVTNELKWRTDEEAQKMTLAAFRELTLKEISDQVKELYTARTTCVVVTYGPLRGEIYEYGNHGDRWERIGVLAGYA